MEQENQQNQQDEQKQHKQWLEEKFKKLKEEYSDDAFIFIGPKNHFFQDSLAIEFTGLTINPKQEKHKLQIDFTLKEFVGLQTQKITTQEVQVSKEFQPFKMRQLIITSKQPKPLIVIEDSQSLNDKNPSTKKNTGNLDLPIFQDDGVYYTPTFATENSKLSKTHYYNQFMNKVKDYRRQVSKDHIMEPRPRSKYMYCAICKDHYEEYLGHVNSKRHFQSYQRNKFARYITSLELTLNTGKFKKEKIIQEKRRATYEHKRKIKQGDCKNSKNKRQKCQNFDETSSQGSCDQEQSQSKSKQVKIKESQNSQKLSQKDEQINQKIRERTRNKKKLQKSKAKNDRKVNSRKSKTVQVNQDSSQLGICKKQ